MCRSSPSPTPTAIRIRSTSSFRATTTPSGPFGSLRRASPTRASKGCSTARTTRLVASSNSATTPPSTPAPAPADSGPPTEETDMAEVTAQLVKELRDRTQAGMSDCKSALVEAAGDMEKAVEVILKKGLAKSAKRAGAVASEGEIRALVAPDGKSGVLVEVNIQTDFAARNDKFKAFVGDVVKVAAAAKDGDNLDNLPYPGTGKTVAQVRDELIAQIGEKITVRRWTKLTLSGGSGAVHAYVHLGGKIGVLLETSAGSAEVAAHPEFKKFIDDAAMQIAAMT